MTDAPFRTPAIGGRHCQLQWHVLLPRSRRLSAKKQNNATKKDGPRTFRPEKQVRMTQSPLSTLTAQQDKAGEPEQKNPRRGSQQKNSAKASANQLRSRPRTGATTTRVDHQIAARTTAPTERQQRPPITQPKLKTLAKKARLFCADSQTRMLKRRRPAVEND